MSLINVQSGSSATAQSGIASLIQLAPAQEAGSSRPAPAGAAARAKDRMQDRTQGREQPQLASRSGHAGSQREPAPPAADNEPAQPTAAKSAKAAASRPAPAKRQPNFLELMSQFLAVANVPAATPVEASVSSKPPAGSNPQAIQAVGGPGQAALAVPPSGGLSSGTLQVVSGGDALTGTLQTQPAFVVPPSGGPSFVVPPSGGPSSGTLHVVSGEDALAGTLQTQPAFVVPPSGGDAPKGAQTPSGRDGLTGTLRTESAASAVSPAGWTDGDVLTGTVQTHPGGTVADSFPRPWSLGATAANGAAVTPADMLAQAVRDGSAQVSQKAAGPIREAADPADPAAVTGLQAVQAAQASHQAAHQAAATAGADASAALGEADPASGRPLAGAGLGDQISVSLSSAGIRAGQEIVVRLDPPSLGEVRIRLSSDNGHVVGRLEVSRPATLAQLEQEAPGLIQRLADQGIQMHKLDLTLSDNGFSRNQDGQRHQGDAQLGQQAFANQEQQTWQDRWAQAGGLAMPPSGGSPEDALTGPVRTGPGRPGPVEDSSLNFWI